MKETVLKHVDTLYLYYKCTHAEYNMALYEGGFSDETFIAYSQGYDWHDVGIARIGIMDYDKAKRANTYSIVIQYNATYLMTKIVNDVKLFFSDDKEKYIIKRIDYAYTFNIEEESFDHINDLCVSRFFRKQSLIVGSDRKIETLYLGLRRTGKVFRLYNKSKELVDKNNHEKKQILFHHFGTLQNLFVYEIELHRKYLRDRCGINSLAELDKLSLVVYTLFSSLQFCIDTEENRVNIKNKNYDRIYFQTPFVDIYNENVFDFLPVKKYEKSKDFLITRINDIIKQYNEKDGHKLTIEELLANMDIKHLDREMIAVDVTYGDAPFVVDKKELDEKIVKLRDNQSNELELEADNIFKDNKVLGDKYVKTKKENTC